MIDTTRTFTAAHDGQELHLAPTDLDGRTGIEITTTRGGYDIHPDQLADVIAAMRNITGTGHDTTALDQVRALAAELTAEADRSPVGSDEYIDLHTIAARIRAAATPTTHRPDQATDQTETSR